MPTLETTGESSAWRELDWTSALGVNVMLRGSKVKDDV